MLRIVVTLLIFVCWHMPSTFFAPAAAPASGWLIWPFGKASTPRVRAFHGLLAPDRPPAPPSPTVALVAAGVAFLAFVAAAASLWGVVVPASWLPPSLIAGALTSALLFAIYLGPWAVVPLLADAVVLWGVLIAGWTQAGLTTP